MSGSRIQVWLARGAIAGALLLLVFVSFPSGPVTSIRDGNDTVYSQSAVRSVFLTAALGGLTWIGAIVFWIQPAAVFRLGAIVLGSLGTLAILNAPTGLNHRLTVSQNRFTQRIGAWYSPEETTIAFETLSRLAIHESQKNKSRILHCYPKDGGRATELPINDLLQAALPQIMLRAAQHNVAVLGQGELQ